MLLFLSLIKKIFAFVDLQEKNLELFQNKEIKIIKFSKLVNNNIKLIKGYKKNQIIQPFYYSNNKILN